MKALKPLFIGGVIAASPFVAMHGASATHASWEVSKACRGDQVAFTVHVTNDYTETLEFHYATSGSFFATLTVAPGQTLSGSAGVVTAAKDTAYVVGIDHGTRFVPDGAQPVGLTPVQISFTIHQGDCGYVVPTTTTAPPPTAIIGTPTSIVPAPTVATTAAAPTPTAPSVTPETANRRQSPPRAKVAVPGTGLPATCLVQTHCSVTANGDTGILSFPVDGHGNPHGVLLAGVAVVAVVLVLAWARHGRTDTPAS